MAVLVELKKASCTSEDGITVVEDATASFSSGQRVVITSANGNAANCLLGLIAGIVTPVSGSAHLFGKDVSTLDLDMLAELRTRVGFLFHDSVLVSNLKVIENVALPIIYHSELSYEDGMARAQKLLDLAGYRGEVWALPGPLPLHVRKKVCVARALALAPQVVVCENIASGLAHDEAMHLTELLVEYQARRAADRLLIMTVDNAADAVLVKPDRQLRIEGNRLVE
ncbi:MAG: ATP-binding cassette domain-containing protein [Proteobacteria bacterium]|nr:ATP-binding cassette domain-containing protein [Pseudomonadota bacterium]